MFLEVRLEQRRHRLEAVELRQVTYAALQGIVNVASEESMSGGKIVRERSLLSEELLSLSNELAEATADRIRDQSLVNGDPGASARALDNVAFGALRQMRAEVPSEYSNMMARFAPAYPPATALAEQLAALDRSIKREATRIGPNLKKIGQK